MSGGNGTKYVTLLDDKAVHLYAETEATVCGIPIPIASGAEWTYAEPEKVCKACDKVGAPEMDDPRDENPPASPLASDGPTSAVKVTKPTTKATKRGDKA